MTRTTIVITIVVVVVALLMLVRTASAQSLPSFSAQNGADEGRVAKFVDSFLRSDSQARQLLNQSNVSLFAEGYRPRVGVPHDPATAGKASKTLQAYFARKIYLDLRALQPFSEPSFQRFVDRIGDDSGETIMCAGDLAEKYELNIQGRFIFERELAKVPAGPERERFKECWLNDAVLGTELRMLAWIYSELFGKAYVNPEDRGSA